MTAAVVRTSQHGLAQAAASRGSSSRSGADTSVAVAAPNSPGLLEPAHLQRAGRLDRRDGAHRHRRARVSSGRPEPRSSSSSRQLHCDTQCSWLPRRRAVTPSPNLLCCLSPRHPRRRRLVRSMRTPLDLTGRTQRCLNLGSYNYLGFAAADEYCTPRVLDTLEDWGVSSCSPRTEAGESCASRGAGRAWHAGLQQQQQQRTHA